MNQNVNNVSNSTDLKTQKNKKIIISLSILIILILGIFIIFKSTSSISIKKEKTNDRDSVVHIYDDFKYDVRLLILGHTDHGKTELATFLSNHYGDNLDFETIDEGIEENAGIGAGYNFSSVRYTTSKRTYQLIDYPTNSDFVKATLEGSYPADSAILVVSATEGPMAQTRTQLELAKNTGIKNIVVFLDKVDKVSDNDLIEIVEAEIKELLKECGFTNDISIIEGSTAKALEGDKKYISSIKKLVEEIDTKIPEDINIDNKQMLFKISDVFSNSSNVLVSGILERGTIKKGDKIDIIGINNKKTATVVKIEDNNRNELPSATSSELSIYLSGVTKEEVAVGQVLAEPGSISAHSKFSAHIYYLTKEEKGSNEEVLKPSKKSFRFTSKQIDGTIEIPNYYQEIKYGEDDSINVTLENSFAMEVGTLFSIWNDSRKIALGVVTNLSD